MFYKRGGSQECFDILPCEALSKPENLKPIEAKCSSRRTLGTSKSGGAFEDIDHEKFIAVESMEQEEGVIYNKQNETYD